MFSRWKHLRFHDANDSYNDPNESFCRENEHQTSRFIPTETNVKRQINLLTKKIHLFPNRTNAANDPFANSTAPLKDEQIWDRFTRSNIVDLASTWA
jgi:hypothetical protein